ncbi:MAG: class I SAM-dependent methyltransferase [Verrucomicrobiota bacterium]
MLARADVSGDRLICEFGVWKAFSINFIAQRTQKQVYGFDSFEGLPEEWGGDSWKKGDFALPALPKVRGNVTLIKGWFNDSIPPFLKEHAGQVGFLHVDSDLYTSAKIVFELLEPRLGPGTVIVFDEYFNFPQWEQGEHKAFTEFLSRTKLSCEYIGYHRHGQQLALILRP